MKTVPEAVNLAKTMVKIGEHVGKKTVAMVTNMDVPLGKAVGNSLEVVEACETLKGRGPKDLETLCLELSANMMYLAGIGTISECRLMAKKAIEDGSALEKLSDMVTAQGGDAGVLQDYSGFKQAKLKYELKTDKTGYIESINTENCGRVAMILGAGRETKESSIDFSAGILLNKKVGERIKCGEVLATLYSDNIEKCRLAEKLLLNAIKVSDTEPKHTQLIYARVSADGVEEY